jgi:hypothetical protein
VDEGGQQRSQQSNSGKDHSDGINEQRGRRNYLPRFAFGLAAIAGAVIVLVLVMLMVKVVSVTSLLPD